MKNMKKNEKKWKKMKKKRWIDRKNGINKKEQKRKVVFFGNRNKIKINKNHKKKRKKKKR